jgi:hypothetical protein
MQMRAEATDNRGSRISAQNGTPGVWHAICIVLTGKSLPDEFRWGHISDASSFLRSMHNNRSSTFNKLLGLYMLQWTLKWYAFLLKTSCLRSLQIAFFSCYLPTFLTLSSPVAYLGLYLQAAASACHLIQPNLVHMIPPAFTGERHGLRSRKQ